MIADISELFKKFQLVKDYYQLKLSPETDQQVAASYKKTIENEFFPARGYGKASLSIVRKAVMYYKKVCRDQLTLLDMMLFYVEQGVKFTTAYGDIDAPFHRSMEKMFGKTTKTIAQQGLREIAQQRCRKIVSDASPMGWRFHDMLSEIYANTLGK